MLILGTSKLTTKVSVTYQSQRWHVLGDGSGVVQRDVYSAFLARCVMSNTHHPSHIESMWAAQKPVLLQTASPTNRSKYVDATS